MVVIGLCTWAMNRSMISTNSLLQTCKSKRHVSLEDKSSFLTIKKGLCYCCHVYKINYGIHNNFLDKKGIFSVSIYVSVTEDCRSDTCIGNPHQEGLTHLDPRRWLPGRLLSDVQEAGCHCDSARGGSW